MVAREPVYRIRGASRTGRVAVGYGILGMACLECVPSWNAFACSGLAWTADFNNRNSAMLLSHLLREGWNGFAMHLRHDGRRVLLCIEHTVLATWARRRRLVPIAVRRPERL